MLVSRQQRRAMQQKQQIARMRAAVDTSVRPGESVTREEPQRRAGLHPFTRVAENARLYDYESRSKQAFDNIEPVLRKISQYQYRADFSAQAQRIAKEQLGFSLPEYLLDNTWLAPLDMRTLYAWCVFETFKRFADEFYHDKPLSQSADTEYQTFIESCGFHTLDFSPCADGRLAHIIRYVLRLPHRLVRRKSYAGAMFDVEDNLQKWVETEFGRQREYFSANGKVTRYLKVAVYHYSSSHPDHEGCAAHGSDPIKAAEGALSRLMDFQEGVENSFCCGASIDLLLIGIDTDNDAIRIHLPDEKGYVDGDCYVDAREVYDATRDCNPARAEQEIAVLVKQLAKAQGVSPADGMLRLATRLLLNNISQIDYVRSNYQGCYADIGHQERFIGMGIGFEEIQLRNLTYFAYLKTVELGAKDLDVGVKIFTGLNVSRGLPIPVVIRYDYHGNVPGAKERAIARCENLDLAFRKRFSEQAASGMLHTLLVVRDCHAGASIEVIASSAEQKTSAGAH